MALLKIIKLTNNVWKHNADVGGDFILTKFYAKNEFSKFLIVESYGSKRFEYLINEIEVYDIGGSAETFTTFDLLFIRLKELGYTGYYEDGTFIFVPSDYISSDVSNALVLGADGKYFVPVASVSTTLEELTDTEIVTPVDGQTLVYNDGIGKWENSTPAGGSSPLKYHLSRVVSNTLTGTTAETIMNASTLLPVDFLDNGSLDLIISGNRTCITAGFTTIRMYVNSSHSLTGASLIGTYLLLATNAIRNLYMDRNIVFSPTIMSTNNAISMQTGSGTIGNARNQNFTYILKDNPYIIITYENAQADTTAIFEKINIKLYN